MLTVTCNPATVEYFNFFKPQARQECFRNQAQRRRNTIQSIVFAVQEKNAWDPEGLSLFFVHEHYDDSFSKLPLF